MVGEPAADEFTPAASDFLARLTLDWESSTEPVEELGIRRVIVRNAIVLAASGGLFPLMSLPSRLFVGGRLGDGAQMVPWIHLADQIRAVRCLLDDASAHGAYNLVAPARTCNSEFMSTVCRVGRRPYWLHMPALLLRLALGDMADLVLQGRACTPKRLLETGFQFEFPRIEDAVQEIFSARHTEVI